MPDAPVTSGAERALLDNVFWSAFDGAQRRFTVGGPHARRYAPGFSPILAFPDAPHPDFDAAAAITTPGERFYLDQWDGVAPADWAVVKEARMLRMLWDAPPPVGDAAPEALALGHEHAEAAVALAVLTNPGPFGLRTPELGEYYGLFDDGSLVAMAGERMEAAHLREVSGICTHPTHQGRGLARRLTLKVVARQHARGQRTFLHVMAHNTGALALYEALGFKVYRETCVRIVERQA